MPLISLHTDILKKVEMDLRNHELSVVVDIVFNTSWGFLKIHHSYIADRIVLEENKYIKKVTFNRDRIQDFKTW